MTESEELERTSDVLLGQLAELEELERTKRDLPDGSQAQVRSSRQVESLARKVLRTAGDQTELVETISRRWPTRPRPRTSRRRRASRTRSSPTGVRPSARWSRRRRAPPGGRRLRAEVERLRAEYRRAFRVRGDRP